MSPPKEVSQGVFRYRGKYYTMNLLPGKSHHGEELIKVGDHELRHWEPHRSKLGAYLRARGRLPTAADDDILYLGAGDGTTVSYLSDVLTHGKIFAVEFSHRPYRQLLKLSEVRKNIFPILADANKPEIYLDIVPSVDLLYQDIAQRDQSGIYIKNIPFLHKRGHGLLAVKARSIDVTKDPGDIYRDIANRLEAAGMELMDIVHIGPWQKDHAIIDVIQSES